jgi:NADH-quinone oxidoreductase subunit I
VSKRSKELSDVQPNDKNIKWVKEPELGLSGRMYLGPLLDGLATTARHFMKTVRGEAMTRQFPEERPEFGNPLIYRGVHRLNKDEQGRVKCVACFLCATACPAHCIDIIGTQAPWPDREKYPQSFVIDELRCIYCGMCEEACPVDAIELTSLFDLTGASREEMIFDKEKLLSVYDATVEKEPMRSRSSAQPAGKDN